MYLDDRPIAFNLGITAGDRYSYLKTSFDEELRPLSPATVLRARLVESLCAEGLQHLDFPGNRIVGKSSGLTGCDGTGPYSSSTGHHLDYSTDCWLDCVICRRRHVTTRI